MSVPEFIPLIFEFVGTIMIGLAVLKIHAKIGKDHKIDKQVVQIIKRERLFTIIGLILISLGFILNFL